LLIQIARQVEWLNGNVSFLQSLLEQ
jgi:hypothetical protein